MTPKSTPRRIELPEGDYLVPDEDFCREVLGGTTTRTAQRFDHEGLPFVLIKGAKWRPVNEGRRWLAARIVRRGQEPQRHRRSA
jgi:hypothetical protein